MEDYFDPEAPITSTTSIDGGQIVTAYGIGEWLLNAREEGATHLVVVCDTFDHTDYPVQVMPDEDVHETVAHFREAEMQRVMEVYWLAGDWAAQLAMKRCFEYGPDNSEPDDFDDV